MIDVNIFAGNGQSTQVRPAEGCKRPSTHNAWNTRRKVMNLQKFKVSIANAVINSENASMKTMNTDQLLDLFTSAETSKKVFTNLFIDNGRQLDFNLGNVFFFPYD